MGNCLQFTLIASWTLLDTESDRWGPPINDELAKKILYVPTWIGTHLSAQLRNKKGKMKKSRSSLSSTAGHPAVGHHCHPRPDLLPLPSPAQISSTYPIPGRLAMSSEWRPWHGAPGGDMGWRVATSSRRRVATSSGRGEGSGRRGAGWGDAVRAQACLPSGGGQRQGGRRWWPADGWRFGMTYFFHFSFFHIFMLTCEWVPVHLNKLCHVSVERWVPHVSFRVNSASIWKQCTLLAICWILVVFCDPNVKPWFSKIYPSISLF
jgi:hypothetical protein